MSERHAIPLSEIEAGAHRRWGFFIEAQPPLPGKRREMGYQPHSPPATRRNRGAIYSPSMPQWVSLCKARCKTISCGIHSPASAKTGRHHIRTIRVGSDSVIVVHRFGGESECAREPPCPACAALARRQNQSQFSSRREGPLGRQRTVGNQSTQLRTQHDVEGAHSHR